MSTTPVYLTSSDTNAPDLDGTPGALNNVLKWALPQMGWTVEFEDAAQQKVVYRNSPVDGLGAYIQVDDSASIASSYSAYAVPITGYGSMTAVDTGAGQFATNNKILRYPADESSPNGPRTWRIVGDNRTFYWMPEVRYWQWPALQGFGEFYSYVPTDNGYFFINGLGLNPDTNEYTHLFARDGAFSVTLFNHDGTIANRPIWTYMNRQAFGNSQSVYPFDGNTIYQPLGGTFLLAPIALMERIDAVSTSSFAVRGHFRGLYLPSCNIDLSGHSLFSQAVLNTPNGAHNCLAVKSARYVSSTSSTSSNAPHCWIDLESWG